MTLYRNGLQDATGAPGFTPNQSPTANYVMLNNDSVNGGAFGDFYIGAVWNRVLDPDEVRTLSDNPWALFA